MQTVGVGQNYSTGRFPFMTQMHIHGWSNHNGAQKPGSLQYNHWQADSAGVDVLWWTEHHGQFRQDTFDLSFSGGVINNTTLDIEGLGLPASGMGHFNQWKCVSNPGNNQVQINQDTLILDLSTPMSIDSTFTIFSYSPNSNLGLIKEVEFTKPMVARPVLEFEMNPQFVDAEDARIRMIFRLSWHYRQQECLDVLIYDFYPLPATASVYSNNVDTVRVVVPVSSGWQNIELDLMDAAGILDHGLDNVLGDLELQLISRLGIPVNSQFRGFRLVPMHYETDSIINGEKSIINDYSALNETHHILGIEFSGDQHLNGFFPKTVANHAIFEGRMYGSINKWVDKVHNYGGLVSYNHMFGADWTADSVQIQDFRTDTLVAHILSNQAYGADILEVGYLARGGGDLKHHLLVWDKLTANGLFLYGNGVSDTHGDVWLNNDGLFHTWIWSSDSSDLELLESLSLGKMYFGNPAYFQGEFYYTVDNLEMGDRGLANNSAAYPQIHLNPLPTGCKVKITQAILNNSVQLTYMYNDSLVNLSALPLLDLTQPCFIRFSVYDSLDRPLLFGQPVVVLGSLTTHLISPEESNDMVSVKMYPNPAEKFLHFETIFRKGGNYTIRLHDHKTGFVRSIDERYFYPGKFGYSVDLTTLSAGNYLIQIEGFNFSKAYKFVKY